MLPIAANISNNAVQDLAGSALPGAPVVPDPPPRDSYLRAATVAFLRRSAQRRARLADRLDPSCPTPGYAR